jgi:hypothetical protein
MRINGALTLRTRVGGFSGPGKGPLGDLERTQQEIAADYAKAMIAGREFPPVDVFFDGAVYWLADGYHRVLAADSLGLAEIDCTVHDGDLSDAIWFSCSANAAHGLRRPRDDVQLAIERALKHPKSAGLSDRQIAGHVGCSHPTVISKRRELEAVGKIYQQNERTGGDGKTYRADAKRGSKRGLRRILRRNRNSST